MATELNGLNQWIELSRESYHRNLGFFRRLIGPRRELCAVVKANAYGHGISEIVRMARQAEARPDSFAVHSLDEALELRELGVDEPILLLGYTPHGRLGEVVENGLRVVVYDAQTVRELDRLAKAKKRRVDAHVKVETGAHRQGLEGRPLIEVLDELERAEGVRAEGIYTHFANIEDTTRHDYARGQIVKFREALEKASQRGLDFEKIHSACSAAVLLFPETYGNMVRLGISQYGLWPSRQTFLSYRLAHPDEGGMNGLEPVLTWKCRVSQVKEVPAGRYVSYGCTYLTTRPTRLAVLPVGYSDGYDRALSNMGYVLIKGRRAQVRGRVCMNLIMVDVTDIEGVRPEDEVVLLGTDGKDRITAEDIGDMTSTINYEVVARIRNGIPRVVV
jgi:alanine racemase